MIRGNVWLREFFRAITKIEKKNDWDDIWSSDTKRTDFLGKVMEGVAKEINCWVLHRNKDNKELSQEMLGIDAFFICNDDYQNDEENPLVLPCVVAELENEPSPKRIAYDVWKTLCIRAPIRVVVCYQRNASDVLELREHLEDTIWQGGLMKGADGDLLILVGDRTIEDRAKWSWKEYFTVFEWRNDRLEKVERIG